MGRGAGTAGVQHMCVRGRCWHVSSFFFPNKHRRPTLQQMPSLAGQASAMAGLYSEVLPQGKGDLGELMGK